MSLGYRGFCKKVLEDDDLVFYTYGGENWNLEHSTWGDINLQDGLFCIYKQCLEEPETHIKTKRLPSSRKKRVTRRISHFPSIIDQLQKGNIVIEKECKNAFRKPSTSPIDYIAYRLLIHIFWRYQTDGKLPESESFIQ